MGKRIQVDYMARVEGEAALDIRLDGKEIKKLQLEVFEPPRFFQGFLVGRDYDEVPDIVSRICGICPVSHQMASVQALEDALGVQVSEQTKQLRRLLALSQFIQSHILHVYMLAVPDFMGYESVLEMVEEYKPVVERALRLKRLGNDLTNAVGGREVHPVTTVVGGISSLPDEKELEDIKERLKAAREDMRATLDLALTLDLPGTPRESEHVSIRPQDGTYAVYDGRLVSTEGLDIAPAEYRDYIKEEHVAHSNALHSSIEGRGSFLVGPLARLNLNADRLSDNAKELVEKAGIDIPDLNPYHSIVARIIETMHSIDASIEIIEGLDYDEPPTVEYEVQAGEGFALTEAPRGTLYHSYEVADDGTIQRADIVTPTAHNVKNMEQDLRATIPEIYDLPEEEMALRCETVVRNYDPCFSCSAHFLDFNLERE